MTAPEIELREHWRRIAGSRHQSIIDDLLLRHREPHRHYHTATHVMWVCRHVSELSLHHTVDDPHAVLAAALFHDAIYDPRSTTNEADSARLAVRQMTDVGWTADRCAVVADLVLATAHHRSTTLAQAVLLDADLAILGAQASAYLPYTVGVRAEYGHVNDDVWRIGRATVLQQFLDRPEIYRTTTMQQARQHRARANLTAELASLQDDR